MSRFRWLTGNEDANQVGLLTRDLLQVDLHPSANQHLTETTHDSELAFPRLERHDGYLFGTFFVPANVDNPSADFDAVTFVVTHDNGLACVVPHSTSTRDWTSSKLALSQIDSDDSTPDGGQFISNLLQLVISESIKDVRSIRNYLADRTTSLSGAVDLTQSIAEIDLAPTLTSRQRRQMLHELRELIPTVAGIAVQVPRLRRIANETSAIIGSLVKNESTMDLDIDAAGNSRELFSRHLEIHLADYFLDSRRLLALLDEIDGMIASLTEKMRRLAEEENVAAGRFTGAIASIMLLPTFIVGLYGQNFVDMPEKDWHYGYVFSWATIVLLTSFQVFFFRRRRWL